MNEKNFTRHNLDFIAYVLKLNGIRNIVVAPGSRNAPLIAAFIRIGGFNIHSVVDERCAAFTAMGMSLATSKPTVVICTSGSAAANFYPAVLEAFYQRVPLLLITADRPFELIDNWDGQAIHQKDLFGVHVVGSFELPQDIDHINREDYISSLLEKALKLTLYPQAGPVHLNVPLRDPIYENIETELPHFQYRATLPLPETDVEISQNVDAALQEIADSTSILVVLGQMNDPSPQLKQALERLAGHCVVIADITSNCSNEGLQHWELALQQSNLSSQHRPQVLLTMGLSVISKKLKQFLRVHKPEKHFHLSVGGSTGDPFFTKPETVNDLPASFIQKLLNKGLKTSKQWIELWENACNNLSFPSLKGTEFDVVAKILQQLKANEVVHFSNSMPVRYASVFGNSKAVFQCNRGVSGIDGSTSTAIGYALKQPLKKHYFITGDVSFFYDSNAFWQNKLPKNLVIVVLNNYGGNIFEIIEGPAAFKPLLTYVKTPHTRTAELVCKDYGLTYKKIKATEFEFHELNASSENTALLEIECNAGLNIEFFKELRS